MIIFLLIATIIIFLIDGMPLYKKKLWKELVVFSLLFVMAFSIVMSEYAGLTSPINILNDLFSKYGKALFGNTM